MKLLEKYRLYRNIIKHKPSSSILHDSYHPVTGSPFTLLERIEYNFDCYCISAYREFKVVEPYEYPGEMYLMPVCYFAFIDTNQDDVIKLKSLFAKRLFNHGKKYSK